MNSASHMGRDGRAGVWVSLAVLFILTGCLDPYPPPVAKGEINFLVVDAFLNSGNGLASVKLSRALPLEASTPYPPVLQADVRVERQDGIVFTIPEVKPGTYQVIRTDMQIGSNYRLLITTPDARNYQSDFVVLKQSPLLEDVSWTHEGDGISIHVDARDPSGSTRY